MSCKVMQQHEKSVEILSAEFTDHISSHFKLARLSLSSFFHVLIAHRDDSSFTSPRSLYEVFEINLNPIAEHLAGTGHIQ